MKKAAATLPFLALLLGAVQDPAPLLPGLLGEYYDIGEEIMDFPSLKGRTPAYRHVDRRIDFASTDGVFNRSGLRDSFTVRWTGVLRVPKDGTYNFYLESDDGSKLYLNGKLLVDDGGLHGMEEASAEIKLKAGDYPIRIDYFDNTGGAGIKLSWDSDDVAREIIPAKALLHPKDAALDK